MIRNVIPMFEKRLKSFTGETLLWDHLIPSMNAFERGGGRLETLSQDMRNRLKQEYDPSELRYCQ